MPFLCEYTIDLYLFETMAGVPLILFHILILEMKSFQAECIFMMIGRAYICQVYIKDISPVFGPI